MKKWFLAIGLILVLIASSLIGCASPEARSESIVITNQQEGISVNGQGRVAITPDIAILTLGVQSQEKTVASAQSTAIDCMNKIVLALNGNGVASEDIQTQRFSIQIITAYDTTTQQDTVIEYLVTNIITAKIRIPDNTGVIIDAAASAGGDLVRIENISFSIDDPTMYHSQAREKAMADAKAKAEQMARLSGTTVGKPIYISESTSFPITSPIKSGESAPSATPINPGEINITVTVQIVYTILK